jgi:hypothetical protein
LFTIPTRHSSSVIIRYDIDMAILCLCLEESICRSAFFYLHQNRFPDHSLCYIDGIALLLLMMLLLMMMMMLMLLLMMLMLMLMTSIFVIEFDWILTLSA